jgi:chain length determinant protein tyrosine kinase EpsG
MIREHNAYQDQAGPPARSITGPQHYHAPNARRLGEWMSGAGLIDARKSDEIARYGSEHGLRFGAAAVALGHVSQADLDLVLAAQFDASRPAGSLNDPQIVFDENHVEAADAFRSLRNTLALRWFKHEQGARTLAVVCPDEYEGRAAFSANLAIAFAQVGFRTLLIDADLRDPTLHTLFRLDDHQGLAGYLAGRPETGAFYDIGAVPNLTVMPVGGTPPNPQELLLRGLFHELLRRAEAQFEVILVNTPAASTASDYLLVGAEAVGVLLVTVAGQTRTEQARDMVRQCREFGIRIVGSTMIENG